jgi:hypothetical protein
LLEFLPDCNEENSGLQIKHKSRNAETARRQRKEKKELLPNTTEIYKSCPKTTPPPQKKTQEREDGN